MPLPVARLLALGTAASGVAVAGCMLGPAGTALAGVASGALTNFFAALAQPGVDAPPDDDTPEARVRNGDLRKLVGVAIRDVILLETRDAARARKLAAHAVELWTSEAAAADASLAPLGEQSVVGRFATGEIDFDRQTALDVPAWRGFLDALARAAGVELPGDLRDRLAGALHARLAQMLRGVAKQDFTGGTEAGGRGFASLQLALLGRLVEGVDRLLAQRADRPTGAELDELRAFSARVPEAAARHDRRVTDSRERAAVAKVLQRIDQLGPRLDARLDALARAVAAEGIKTRAEVRGVDRKIVYALAATLLVGLLVLAGMALSRSSARRADGAFADMQAKLDAIARDQQRQLQANPDAPPTLADDDRRALAEIRRRGDALQQVTAAALEQRFDDARRLLGQIDEQRVTEEPFRYFTAKGDVAYFAGQFDDAVQPYEQALALRPDDLGTRASAATAHSLAATGDLAAHGRRAIELCEATLAQVPRASPGWADAQINLGIALTSLPTGDRAEHLRRAVDAFEAALAVHTRAARPNEWATAQTNLGAALTHLPTGDRAENLTRAVAAFEAALTVHTRAARPDAWAAAQNNLGTALLNLPADDPAGHLRRAAEAFEAALTVFTQATRPDGWAAAQINLGSALTRLPTGDPTDNLRRAVAAFEAVLSAFSRADRPANWAAAQHNLAIALRKLPAGDRAAPLRRSIEAYEASLTVYTRLAHPAEWAATQQGLATTLAELAEQPGEDARARLRAAIACGKGALRVYTPEAFPAQHAAALENLNLDKAAYEAAGGAGFEDVAAAE